MLTKENLQNTKDFLAGLIEVGGIYKMLSDIGINIGVNQIDKQLLDKINPIYHNVINEILAHLFDGDYESAIDKTAILLADVVKTPLVDGTPEEIEVYHQFLTLLKVTIEYFVAKKSE